jgi:chromosome segregation ATPase
MESSPANKRAELEAEINQAETAVEELSREQERLTRQQQHSSQEHQDNADRQSIRRSEIQAQLGALEPQKQASFATLTAEEAGLTAQMQRLQRDADLPPDVQDYPSTDRAVEIERIQSRRDEIAAERAKVEEQAARQSAAFQSEMAQMEPRWKSQLLRLIPSSTPSHATSRVRSPISTTL